MSMETKAQTVSEKYFLKNLNDLQTQLMHIFENAFHTHATKNVFSSQSKNIQSINKQLQERVYITLILSYLFFFSEFVFVEIDKRVQIIEQKTLACIIHVTLKLLIMRVYNCMSFETNNFETFLTVIMGTTFFIHNIFDSLF